MGGGALRPSIAAAVCAMLAAGPATAQPQTPTARERELEDLVRTLNQRLEHLEQRVVELESGKADRQTEARVQDLEQSVQQIREEPPAAIDPQRWAKMEKWFEDSHTLRPFWKDGLRFESADGDFKLRIGGRIQTDFAYFCEDGDVERQIGEDFEDDAEFRRARLYVSGEIYENTFFKAQYDFAGGDAAFKDVYLGLDNVPGLQRIVVGQFKEPFSLEELTSSNHVTFMERSLANTFAPARNIGVMVNGTKLDEHMTWAVGVFRQTDDDFGEAESGRAYDVTGRVTGLPIYEDDGRQLLHLGLAYAYRNYEDDEARFRSRPESHLAPNLADTGTFPADFGNFVGAEAAWVCGPFSLQSEWIQAFIEGSRRRTGDPHLGGGYVQASYFLTGEHRPYKRSDGVFDNVKPKSNFSFEEGGGAGAWELAVRYSYLDLNDAGVRGGLLRDLTVGLNWYLNPSLRLAWNYVLADPGDGGDINIFQWRFQVAF